MMHCSAGAIDEVNVAFKQLYDVYKLDDPHDITPLCGSPSNFYDEFVSRHGGSAELRVVSRHHQMIGAVAECATPTISPTPTSSPS